MTITEPKFEEKKQFWGYRIVDLDIHSNFGEHSMEMELTWHSGDTDIPIDKK